MVPGYTELWGGGQGMRKDFLSSLTDVDTDLTAVLPTSDAFRELFFSFWPLPLYSSDLKTSPSGFVGVGAEKR